MITLKPNSFLISKKVVVESTEQPGLVNDWMNRFHTLNI